MARRRHRLLLAGLAVVLALAFGLGSLWWLTRDPTAHILARRSHLVSVERESLTTTGSTVVERLRLRAASGLVVELAVQRPVDPPGQPRRKRSSIVLIGGYETGRDAVNLIADPRGLVIAALSYPYRGTVPHGPRVALAVPALRAAILDTPAAILLAHDYLRQDPGIDPDRVELVGVSLGAIFAVEAGALDRRFRRVWSVHGAGYLPLLIDHGLRGRIPAARLRRVVTQLAFLAGAGPAVAPERWVGKIAPRPFVMINAADDERLPRAAILRLYNAAREPKELHWLSGRHIEPNRPEVIAELLDQVLGRVVADCGGALRDQEGCT